jgi:REP element-mobilizing transposase RayT
MSNHIHMIISRVGEQKLEAVIRDIKKYTSVKITEAIAKNPQESRRELLLWLFAKAGAANPNNTHYQFWQQHNHPIALNTNEKLDQRLNYIHNNPVKAGIVRYPEEYLYSRAGNYARLPENVLEVMLI